MLKVDEKKVTNNLEFNLSPGKFKKRKFLFPVHKTKHGILAVSFKLKLKDVIKVLVHRRVYLQQVPSDNKAPGITIDVAPADFERSIQENEDFFEKQDLEESEGKEVA